MNPAFILAGFFLAAVALLGTILHQLEDDDD